MGILLFYLIVGSTSYMSYQIVDLSYLSGAGYGTTLGYNSGYGAGGYGSYGGMGSTYNSGGLYGNSMYRGGYGGLYGGGSSMYGGGMYNSGYGSTMGGMGMGMGMGTGMGMGMGMGMGGPGGPYGDDDPNNPFGPPSQPPGFWISLMRVVSLMTLFDTKECPYHLWR